MIEAMKQAVVYFEHMVRTLKLRDQSEPAQLLFKLRQAIEQAEKQEAWNIDSKYASLLALTLECMILDPRRWHDDAVKVLDQYRAEWDKLNPSPSPFGKD